MQIGLITYPIKHKKTQQVVNGLIKRNYKNLTLLISSFKKYKKKNIFLIIDQINLWDYLLIN